MKRYIIFIMAFLLVIAPNKAGAVIEGYDIVGRSSKENITLYAKEMNGLYYNFKLDFKGRSYSRPFWTSVANKPTYAPKIIYEDINRDEKKELIIILNKGYGTGVVLEDVYVFDTDNQFGEVLIDNPIAIIYKNVKTKLLTEKAEVNVGDKVYTVDITPLEIKPTNLFNHISFGSTTRYEVEDNQLIVRVGGQISPASFVGEIVIVYEYHDKMYQAKSIEFKPYK